MNFMRLCIGALIIAGVSSYVNHVDTGIVNNYFSEMIKVSIGEPPEEYRFYIDLVNSQCSKLYQSKRLNFTSPQMKEINDSVVLSINNITLRARLVEDSLYLNGNEDLARPFPFLFITALPEKFYDIKNTLALPFAFKDESNSIVHLYYSKGFIDSLAFSFKRIDPQNKVFRIGGLSIEDKADKWHSYSEVIGRDGHWDCLISRVRFQYASKEIEYRPKQDSAYAVFDYIDEAIHVPREFLDAVIGQYAQEIKEQVCSVYTNQVTLRRQLICQNTPGLYKGKISFDIGRYRYRMPLTNLWFCEEEYCDLLLVDGFVDNQWQLGIRFYDRLNVQFSYDEKRIHFYSKELDERIEEIPDENQLVDGNHSSVRVVLALLNVILLMTGIIHVFIIRKLSINTYT